MIKETITHRCLACQSTDLIKNGHSKNGKQQYICKSCGRRGVVNPEPRHTETEKAQILAAYFERPSMRGICRIFNVSRPTLAKWLKKSPGQP
jgi:transposase-like protein